MVNDEYHCAIPPECAREGTGVLRGAPPAPFCLAVPCRAMPCLSLRLEMLALSCVFFRSTAQNADCVYISG